MMLCFGVGFVLSFLGHVRVVRLRFQAAVTQQILICFCLVSIKKDFITDID